MLYRSYSSVCSRYSVVLLLMVTVDVDDLLMHLTLAVLESREGEFCDEDDDICR